MNEFPKARIILDRSKATWEEWLELHDQHLGASDAGAIMGLSPYQTPLSVFMTKKGMVKRQENEFTRWGKLLEEVIRREFVKDFREVETGKSIEVYSCHSMYESTKHPFMCVDPDGLVMINDQLGLLEIKSTTRAQARYWKDESLPDQYFAQVQHGMYVLDLPFSLVVCLMDKKLLWRTVPARKVFMSEMVRMEKRFWEEFILKDQMPGPSGNEIDTDLLLEYYPRQEDVTVNLGTTELVERYLEIKHEVDSKKKIQEGIKQEIIQLMGPAHRAVAGEHKVTRVTFEKPTFNLSGFKKDHPRLAEKYMQSSTVDFPRIS